MPRRVNTLQFVSGRAFHLVILSVSEESQTYTQHFRSEILRYAQNDMFRYASF